MKDIHDILVASDLGHFSEVVVRSAAALAALTGARLHVLHIQEFHPMPYMEFVPAMMITDEAGRLQEALDEQIERTVGPGVEVVSTDVVLDAPPRAILNYAEKVDADLIVIGRDSTLGLEENPDGLAPVIEALLHDGARPLIVVPAAPLPAAGGVLVGYDGSIPAMRTDPDVGRRMPAIIRSVVVFPAPLGPRKPNSSPRGTSRSTLSTAVNDP